MHSYFEVYVNGGRFNGLFKSYLMLIAYSMCIVHLKKEL